VEKEQEIRHDFEAVDEYEYSSDYDIFTIVNKQKAKPKETVPIFLGNKRKREEDLHKFIQTYKDIKYIELKNLDINVSIVKNETEGAAKIKCDYLNENQKVCYA
jgi:hypothetical protein